MISSGSSNGSPRISTAFTNVKTVLLAPMPSDSAATAMKVSGRSL
jgi:hypothetical protein